MASHDYAVWSSRACLVSAVWTRRAQRYCVREERFCEIVTQNVHLVLLNQPVRGGDCTGYRADPSLPGELHAVTPGAEECHPSSCMSWGKSGLEAATPTAGGTGDGRE